MERSQVHNYYEHLVFDYIDEHLAPAATDKPEDYFLDIACVALNNLPVHYVRHSVDTVFFQSSGEHRKIEKQVEQAVQDASKYIDQHFEDRH